MSPELEERLLEGLGEIKRLSQEQIRLQNITNGRIDRGEKRLDGLEDWRRKLDLREAEQEGFRRGSQDTLITGKQLKMGVAIVTGIASLSGAITALLTRLAS